VEKTTVIREREGQPELLYTGETTPEMGVAACRVVWTLDSIDRGYEHAERIGITIRWLTFWVCPVASSGK
jgi:hypothetical protein